MQHHVFPVCFAVSSEEEKERGYVTTFRAFKNVMMSLLKMSTSQIMLFFMVKIQFLQVFKKFSEIN